MTTDNKEESADLFISGIPESVKTRFKLICVERKLSMSEVLVEFMKQFVKKEEE